MNVKDVNLTPAELQAILEHKRFMAINHPVEVTLEEAIEHFILHVRADWMREKHRRDLADQRREIETHKYYRSMHEGRDIGRARAAEEWCEKYAHIWRSERESLSQNGFQRITVEIHVDHPLHLQPSSALASLVSKYNCEMYLHRDNMDFYNFILQAKRYLNVKSVLGLLTVAASPGETLEFIAIGPESAKALEAVAYLAHSGFKLEDVPGRP